MYQLGIDMLTRLKSNEEIVYSLISEDHVMKALDFAHEIKMKGIKASAIKENIDYTKAQGDDIKAYMLANRVAAMKLHDENQKKKNP